MRRRRAWRDGPITFLWGVMVACHLVPTVS